MQHGTVDSLLDCPICLCSMGINGSAIWLCNAGHSFCNVCKPGLQLCPLCGVGFSGAKNFHLQEVAAFFAMNPTHPCPRKSVVLVSNITTPNRDRDSAHVRRKLNFDNDLPEAEYWDTPASPSHCWRIVFSSHPHRENTHEAPPSPYRAPETKEIIDVDSYVLPSNE